ncbi:hypothetical protein [Ralstonia phage phiRSL1]|uniref:Uncharacterized protein n=1 Tax=Ralstonia phage phiRSL1 TaxID=1980924 RepID=B2ZXX3_9CAUD|nr:hypothetical protein RSL1_ORF105 [Ralstonia phage phiRSL1]BAG41549.1 hypothetical protein [Ralstonia phage phiRSL1]
MDLSQQELAILASFVFLPLPKRAVGRRGAEVAQVARPVFAKLFQKYVKGRFALQVTITCKKLVRRGLLYQSGTVEPEVRQPVRMQKAKCAPSPIQSPVFALTESGLWFVLSQCDQSQLCTARQAISAWKHWYHAYEDEPGFQSFQHFAFGAA